MGTAKGQMREHTLSYLKMILTGLVLEDLLVEFLLFDGTSTSECSTVHPIASRAFKDSLTGSL
jgi:hypothetical protein